MLLAATSYRFECLYYRTLLKKSPAYEMENNDSWISQLLQTAMFELDTLVGRALIDGMAKILPLTLYVPTLPVPTTPTITDTSVICTQLWMSLHGSRHSARVESAALKLIHKCIYDS